ncbi:hypothetical protein CHARACLAT_028582 [Characodon lateralis]|uniref:Uncharacterized protein n=1 Tax=Characodon lateralis TaxID=208331 RepID=A0ABU7F991_9TELE|nr:hypothetical protein [Characodon lateralis]
MSVDRQTQKTLYCQKYLLTCLDSHMNLSDIQFLSHRIQNPISPSFAAITASALQERLSTRFRSLFNGLFNHSSRSTFVRTDVDREGLALGLHSNLSQRCSVGLRCRCRPVNLINTKLSSMSLWTIALCTVMLEEERGHLQTVHIKLEHGIVKGLLIRRSIQNLFHWN